MQGTKIYKHRVFTTVEYLFSGTRVIKNYPGSKLPGYPTGTRVLQRCTPEPTQVLFVLQENSDPNYMAPLAPLYS